MDNKLLLKVYTPYGKKYNIMTNGNIQRTDMEFTPSGSWRMLGIEHVKQNWFIPLNELTPELVKELPMLYKNGNPQFTVRDVDHGTTRSWGNTKYHGIKEISFEIPK